MIRNRPCKAHRLSESYRSRTAQSCRWVRLEVANVKRAYHSVPHFGRHRPFSRPNLSSRQYFSPREVELRWVQMAPNVSFFMQPATLSPKNMIAQEQSAVIVVFYGGCNVRWVRGLNFADYRIKINTVVTVQVRGVWHRRTRSWKYWWRAENIRGDINRANTVLYGPVAISQRFHVRCCEARKITHWKIHWNEMKWNKSSWKSKSKCGSLLVLPDGQTRNEIHIGYLETRITD
jgi:hypothetical protein